MFLRGGRKLLERSFPYPTPPTFKNFETGVLFFVVMPALNGRTTYVRTAPECESFGQAFSKACWGLGRVAP